MANPFVDFVAAQLSGCEGLTCLAMFGGHGLYHGRTLVGIVSRGRLYLKADPAAVAECGRRGMRAFRPGHESLRAFIEVPPNVLENPRHLGRWARAAGRLTHDLRV